MLISAAEFAEDRAMVEAEMIDRGRVTRTARPGDVEYVDTSTLDPVTLAYPEQGRVTVYEGRCRVQVRADINSNAVEAVVGEHEWTYRTSTAQFPMAADSAKGDVGDPAAIRSDYVLEILTSPLDESRVGAVLNLQADSKNKTLASHRRFRAREVLS